jgi:four helix bundle protein
MPSYKNFEETPAWNAAADLYNLVLDLLDDHGPLFSPGFRNQMDRAALSVSNNIAEGFDRVTVNELLSFLAIARGSAGEVRSMCLVVLKRRKVAPAAAHLKRIHDKAKECVRQITGWTLSLEESPVQGKRHLTPKTRAAKRESDFATDLRRKFLTTLDPKHPLYDSPEARTARGEKGIDDSR